MKTDEIFKSNSSIMDKLVRNYEYPYEVLSHIKEEIIKFGSTLDSNYIEKDKDIWIHKDAKVAPTALIEAPTIIDCGAEIRHCAYIRGSVIVGKNAVIGNSCEIKNSIIYDEVQVPHFNYVGDSILGYHAHLGAGVILSNLKGDKKNIVINGKETNLRKIGSFLGDYVEIGCNSVLNPGTIILPNTTVYPLTSVRGCIKGDSIVKNMNNIIEKR